MSHNFSFDVPFYSYFVLIVLDYVVAAVRDVSIFSIVLGIDLLTLQFSNVI